MCTPPPPKTSVMTPSTTMLLTHTAQHDATLTTHGSPSHYVSYTLLTALLVGIMHRDLKPGNVLLQGGNGRPGDYSVRLCDFGLARKLEGTDNNLTFDRGTASYIAPEIMAGKKYFFSADVYSFGWSSYSMRRW